MFGALAPKVDKRDYRVAAGASQFPESWQIDYKPAIKNQYQVNSCVAHALSSILEYFNYKELGSKEKLSTDFIYGMQGVQYGRKEQGMYLRDACRIAKNYGDCYAATIGTNTEQPSCTELLEGKLTDKVYAEARSSRVQSYAACNSESAIKHALMNYGPLLGSIKWYNKNEIKDGVIYMDKTSDYGHHAIMIYGWNEKGFLCQNSWGRFWNKDGNFIFPYGEKFAEAWSFVDAANDDIEIPKRNKFFDLMYKFINFVINLFKGR